MLPAGLRDLGPRGAGAADAPAGDSPADPPLRAGAPLVLIGMPPSASFRDVRRSLLNEIQRDFNVATFIVTSTTAADELAGAVNRLAPACVVLMNNDTVSLYHEYQRASAPGTKFPPSVVVMASFIDELRPTLRNATASPTRSRASPRSSTCARSSRGR